MKPSRKSVVRPLVRRWGSGAPGSLRQPSRSSDPGASEARPLLVGPVCFAALALGLLSILLGLRAVWAARANAAPFVETSLLAGLSAGMGILVLAGAVALHRGRQWGWWVLALLTLFGLGGEVASVGTVVLQSRSAASLGIAVGPIPWGRTLGSLLPRLLVYLGFTWALLTEAVRNHFRPALRLTWPRRIPLVAALVVPMVLALFSALMIPAIARSISSNADGLQQQMASLEKARQENERRMEELLAQERTFLESRLRNARTRKERAEIQHLLDLNQARAAEAGARAQGGGGKPK
jgi:hypothetical protein